MKKEKVKVEVEYGIIPQAKALRCLNTGYGFVQSKVYKLSKGNSAYPYVINDNGHKYTSGEIAQLLHDGHFRLITRQKSAIAQNTKRGKMKP